MSNLVLDDRNPEVEYSTLQWGRANSSSEYNSTDSWTAALGATAKIKFTGTGISVYGTIGPQYSGLNPVSLYTLDSNKTAATCHGDAQADTQYNQLFFNSPILDSGEHELTVTNGAEGVIFYLDYFVVNPTNTTASPTSCTPRPTPSAGTQPTSTSNQGSTGAVKGISRTALGGVVTSAIVLAAIIIACYFARRRGRLERENEASGARDHRKSDSGASSLRSSRPNSVMLDTKYPEPAALHQFPSLTRRKYIDPPTYVSPIARAGIPDIRDSGASLGQILGRNINGGQAEIFLASMMVSEGWDARVRADDDD